jgi:hypothetical protein
LQKHLLIKTSVRMGAALADLKVSLSAASFATERIGFVSQKNGTSRSYRFCFGGLRRRTPGPPPHSSGMPLALRIAERQTEQVSDIVVFDPPHRLKRTSGIRMHYVSAGWSVLQAIVELSQLLRNIGIELIGDRRASSRSRHDLQMNFATFNPSPVTDRFQDLYS